MGKLGWGSLGQLSWSISAGAAKAAQLGQLSWGNWAGAPELGQLGWSS